MSSNVMGFLPLQAVTGTHEQRTQHEKGDGGRHKKYVEHDGSPNFNYGKG